MTNKRKYIIKTKKRSSSKKIKNKRTKKLRGGFSWPWSNTNTNNTDKKPSSFFSGWFNNKPKDCSEADCAKYLNKPNSTDAITNTYNSPSVASADNESFRASEEASIANFSDKLDKNYNIEEKIKEPPLTSESDDEIYGDVKYGRYGGKRSRCRYGCNYCKRYNCKCHKCNHCKYKLKKYSKKRKH